jgi:UDP-N-acetylmuramoylalanine--D-glutamate ligase
MIPDAWRQGEVAVVGLGRSGTAASRLLRAHGVRVYASDAARTAALERAAVDLRGAGVDVALGGHDLERIAKATAAVVSPGIPPDGPPIAAARAAGVPVHAELDLGAMVLDRARLVVVTGTNGKTTTTACTAHLMGEAGHRTAAVGNIGRACTELAAEPEPPEWIAVEASSFQLHDAPNLTPAVGVVTNLAPDHLDRYPDVQSYHADKRLLFRNAQADSVWVLNADDPAVLDLASGAVGHRRRWSLEGSADAWYDRARSLLVVDGAPLLEREALPLLGDHNVGNALAAALAAQASGAQTSALARGLAAFRAPAHRLEPVRTVRGVVWLNDSKATNVSAAAVAIRAMTQSFVLVAGGHPKGEVFAPMGPLLEPRCRAVVAYGEAGPALQAELRDHADVAVVSPFDDALAMAAQLAEPGDAVLLSPACASFDQFQNFEQRGARFRAFAEAL